MYAFGMVLSRSNGLAMKRQKHAANASLVTNASSKSFVYDHSCNSFDCLIPIPHAVQGGPKFSIHIALLQGLNALQISSTAMVLRVHIRRVMIAFA